MIVRFRNLTNSHLLNSSWLPLKTSSGLHTNFCPIHWKSQLTNSIRTVLPKQPQTRGAKLATNLLFTTSGVAAAVLWNYDKNGVFLRSKRSQMDYKLSIAEKQKGDSEAKFDWKLVHRTWNSRIIIVLKISGKFICLHFSFLEV